MNCSLACLLGIMVICANEYMQLCDIELQRYCSCRLTFYFYVICHDPQRISLKISKAKGAVGAVKTRYFDRYQKETRLAIRV